MEFLPALEAVFFFHQAPKAIAKLAPAIVVGSCEALGFADCKPRRVQ